MLCGTVFAQTKANPESDFKLIIPELELGDPYYVYVGKSENVVIPKKEFYSDKLIRTAHTTVKVKSVVIPKGVTKIGAKAFENCSSLTKISIPSTVTSIGDKAFWGCSNLKEIKIPDSVTSIGIEAFTWCKKLNEIKIPNSVQSIGSCAFWGCSSLTEVSIPPSVKNTKGYSNLKFTTSVFGEIPNIKVSDDEMVREIVNGNLKSVIILEGVTTIGKEAFKGFKALTSVTIPSTVKEIGDWAFMGCGSLVDVTIPEGVTTIGVGAFYDCYSLTSVTIPSTVKEIRLRTFKGCGSLVDVTISEGVTTIGAEAFYNCWSLTPVTIPSTVTEIGDWAFGTEI